ncbi:hypothetical protein ACKVMT_00860 [Halobacteriales archaeon Cl-PHB]
MPQSAETGRRRSPALDRRAIATGVILFGVVLVLAPTLFWPPATASGPALHVGPVDESVATDPTAYDELPRSLQQAFDAARQAPGSVALRSAELGRLVRQQPYVSFKGTIYRLGVYRGAETALGLAMFGPMAVSVGATALVVGWLIDRRRSLRPLTPVAAALVPLAAAAALWLSPSTGGVLGVPTAVGLAVPAGTMLVPTGSLCMTAGRRYVLLGPLVGIAVGVGSALALGANPARYEAIFGTVAVVALPWFLLGALLTRPRRGAVAVAGR